jgi:hypothetical protein
VSGRVLENHSWAAERLGSPVALPSSSISSRVTHKASTSQSSESPSAILLHDEQIWQGRIGALRRDDVRDRLGGRQRRNISSIISGGKQRLGDRIPVQVLACELGTFHLCLRLSILVSSSAICVYCESLVIALRRERLQHQSLVLRRLVITFPEVANVVRDIMFLICLGLISVLICSIFTDLRDLRYLGPECPSYLRRSVAR